jgi:uncharacterized protein YcnI
MPRPTAVVVALAALAFAAPASAHVIVAPPFLPAASKTTLSLTGPNERDEPMTGFAVSVPNGFRILAAHSPQGWRAAVEEKRAIWKGGSLAAGAEATFHVELEVPTSPGPVELETEQLYPGGEVVRWPIAMVVTPAGEASQHLGLALVVALVGLLVTVGLVVLAWWRRDRSLQEK